MLALSSAAFEIRMVELFCMESWLYLTNFCVSSWAVGKLPVEVCQGICVEITLDL